MEFEVLIRAKPVFFPQLPTPLSKSLYPGGKRLDYETNQSPTSNAKVCKVCKLVPTALHTAIDGT